MKIHHLAIGGGDFSSSQSLFNFRARVRAKSLTQRLLPLSVLCAVLCMVLSIALTSCKSDDSVPDYLNEMIIINGTPYDWFRAEIQFQDGKGVSTKSMEIGTVERRNQVTVQKLDPYFYIVFSDDSGVQHRTEKYLTNTTVRVETIAQ